ncbi:MAG: glycosyltransferase family 4 protein [Bacillota bacterium]
MKIGYFVETPVAKNLTGGVQSFLDLIELLVPMGVDPYVVVSEPWQLTEELDRRGIAYITAKMYRPFVGVDKKSKFYRLKCIVKSIFNSVSTIKAIKFFKSNKVKLIHVNSQFCGLVGIHVSNYLKIPYVYHIREFLSKDFNVKFINHAKATKLIGNANAVVAISDAIMKFEQERHTDANIVKIYNGINYDKFCLSNNDAKFNNVVVSLVIVGRVCESKGQIDAVKAVDILQKQYHKNVKLYIVGCEGNGAYEDMLRDFVKGREMENNVEFVEFTNNPEEIVQKCDIGLMCSRNEAFGRVTIEYMMSGLLTVGANAGGTVELINDEETGLLYEVKNAEDLANKINWVIDNPSAAKQITENGTKNAVDNFSINNTANRVCSLYNAIIY